MENLTIKRRKRESKTLKDRKSKAEHWKNTAARKGKRKQNIQKRKGRSNTKREKLKSGRKSTHRRKQNRRRHTVTGKKIKENTPKGKTEDKTK